MKLATVRTALGERFGAVVDGGFIDLSARFGPRCADVATLLRDGLLDEARAFCVGAQPDCGLDQLEFLPAVNDPGARMFALGVAYKDHQQETGRADQACPSLFMKDGRALVGHGQALVKPRVSDQYDFEGEIAMVIGRRGRHIAVDEAMAWVAGYSIVMDGSVRDYQKHSVTAGKNFDRSGAFGPWLVTADEVAEPGNLDLWLTVNGETMQRGNTRTLIFDVDQIVSDLSQYLTLMPGDIITTGTPPGVAMGMKPPRYLQRGDVIELEVQGLGKQKQRVV